MDAAFFSPSAMQAAAQTAATSYLTQVQSVTPTTGQTVVATADDKDRVLYLTPAGTLAALTVTFPADANSRLGQTITIASSQAITALTLGGATIIGGATSLLAGASVTYIKVASNTWVPV